MVLLTINWEFIISIIFGLSGLILSAVAMRRTRKLEKQQYDLNEQQRKLNEQQEELNRITLEEMEHKKEDAKRAKLKVHGITTDLRCLMRMRIENEGLCDAEELNLKIVNKSLEEHPKGLAFDRPIPSRLEAGDHFDFSLECWTGEDVLDLRIEWTDGNGPLFTVKHIPITCTHD